MNAPRRQACYSDRLASKLPVANIDVLEDAATRARHEVFTLEWPLGLPADTPVDATELPDLVDRPRFQQLKRLPAGTTGGAVREARSGNSIPDTVFGVPPVSRSGSSR